MLLRFPHNFYSHISTIDYKMLRNMNTCSQKRVAILQCILLQNYSMKCETILTRSRAWLCSAIWWICISFWVFDDSSKSSSTRIIIWSPNLWLFAAILLFWTIDCMQLNWIEACNCYSVASSFAHQYFSWFISIALLSGAIQFNWRGIDWTLQIKNPFNQFV